MATLSDVTTVDFSGDRRVDALLHLSASWNHLLPARTTLYYTFDLSESAGILPGADTAFNTAQRAAAASVLAHVTSVTGIRFSEVGSAAQADFHFAATDVAGATTSGKTETSWGYSYTTPGEVLTAYRAEAYVFLDNAEWASINTTPTAGSAGYEVLLHEIGHALGLGHPFEGPNALPAAEDNTGNTVMSYTHVGASKSTFQSYDLLALRWIYGEDGLGGTWGWNSANGPSLTLVPVVRDVFGTSGGDTLVDTSGPARLFGLAGDDRLQGGSGDDTLDGGTGTDTAVYAGAAGGYRVAHTGAGWTVTDRDGGDGVDTLTGIERLDFTDRDFELVAPRITVVPSYGAFDSFLFDPVYYTLQTADLVPALSLAGAWAHYAGSGAASGQAPNAWFDAGWYENRWPDLTPLNLDALTLFRHFNLYGVWEGRAPGPAFATFDGTRYLRDNPDVAAYVDAYVDDFLGSRSNGAIAHYILYGANEQRIAYDHAGQAIRLDYAFDLGA